MASTHSPTRSCRGSPSGAVGRPWASIFSTATSVWRSMPSTRARNSRRLASLTFTSLAPCTTWALVSTSPSAPTMKPDPCPRTAYACPSGIVASSPSAPPMRDSPLTLMCTTVAPWRWAISDRSGSARVGCTGAGRPSAVTAAGAADTAGVRAPVTRLEEAPPRTPAATRLSSRPRRPIQGVGMRVSIVAPLPRRAARRQLCAAGLRRDLIRRQRAGAARRAGHPGVRCARATGWRRARRRWP